MEMTNFSGKSLLIPANFTPAGAVEHVRMLDETPAFIKRARQRKVRGAKLAGLKYEKLVHGELARTYDGQYWPGPWFSFRSAYEGSPRVCQPDGLIIDVGRGVVTIVEIKLRHTVRAWWQLRQLYQPLARLAFPEALGWRIEVCEIFNWYAAGEKLPEKFTQVDSPTEEAVGQFKINRMSLR